MKTLFFLYIALALAFAIFGTFAKFLGMTEATWFFIWGWYIVPEAIYVVGNIVGKLFERASW